MAIPALLERRLKAFLRVQARLSKTRIFNYDNAREYRSPEEVFREDSLASLKGAPVTDLHPMRLLYGLQYEPKSVMSVMRQGRLWVEAQDVAAPFDKVFIKFTQTGCVFTGSKEASHLLSGAIMG